MRLGLGETVYVYWVTKASQASMMSIFESQERGAAPARGPSFLVPFSTRLEAEARSTAAAPQDQQYRRSVRV